MALTEMSHDQPPTPAVTDRSTGDGFVNNNICKLQSRAIDMQFYWFRDRVIQGKFLVYWMAGEHNLPYYFTKNHPTSHHWLKRGAHISYPQWKPVSMHATWHPMTCEGVLNPSPPGEREDRWTKSPSSEGRKRTTDGRRQTGLLGIHNISGNNISLRAPLIVSMLVCERQVSELLPDHLNA